MPSAPERPTGTLGPRLAFLAVILVLPVELGIQWFWSEPYPALTQPAFAFSANEFEVADALPKSEGFVTVAFVDGTEREYTAEELLGWTAGVSPTTILRDTIVEREEDSAETVAWLLDRIAASGEEREAVSAHVRLEFVRIDAHTLTELQRGTSKEFTVDLTGAGS